MSDTDGIPADVAERILDAARAELVASGIDRFRIEGVARRAGVDQDVILARWHDRRVLLIAALSRVKSSEWTRDTGSLYTDLHVVSSLVMESSRTAPDRALFRRILPGDDVDLTEITSDLWHSRFRDGASILQRPVERGQLRDGLNLEDAFRMFVAAMYSDVIFDDAPVRPDYAEQVLDVFLHGVLGATGDRRWADVDDLLHPAESADVPAADEAVEAARRVVVLMRLWADALADPVVLYEAIRDDTGQVIDFVCRDLNRAACEEVGLSRSELLGRTVVEVLPVFKESGLMEHYAECLESGTPLVLNNFGYLHFDEERQLDIRATSAAAEMITVTWRDVTDRFRAAQTDQRYRKLMDFSAVPAALATPDGRLVVVNQALASMLGYDIDTLLSMTWQDLTAPEMVPEELQRVADILGGRSDSYRCVKQYVHADGQRVWGDLSVSCIRRPDGEVENLIAQVVDITEFRKAAGSE
ncbi:MAG: PAS domain S-box protein [Mycobacterium sp.]